MIKLSKNAIIVFFVLAAIAVTLHPLLAVPELSYKLFLVYGIMFTAAFFLAKDTKIDKKAFIQILLFLSGAVMLGAGQYIFSFFKHNILIYGVLLMLGGITTIAAARLGFGDAEELKPAVSSFKAEAAAVAVLAAAAFVMRFWDLSGFLPGVWFDEVQNGVETMSMLDSNRPVIFISGYTHMPAMYFYFASLAVKVFGYNIFSLRLVSCVLGTLSVIAFYFLAKQIFKDVKYALLCAFLLAFSRWHITFSRVAFLGMQTVLFETLFLYFYLKFFETKHSFYALVAGIVLGLSQYTFSAANFVAIFALLHIGLMALRNWKGFIPNFASGVLLMAAASLLAAGPLIGYAVKNKAAFFQRASDISIMRDVEQSKNLDPVIKNLKTYALVFNFEGDYNGRHNLYKKPILDDFAGIFLIIGLITVLCTAGKRYIPGLMLVMLLPGISTITIEAPQTYRIIGVIPAVYLLIAFGVKTTAGFVADFSKNRRAAGVFIIAAGISMAVVNFHQYFFLYPKHEGTYMSFSPEANGVAKFINAYSAEYEIIISTAKKIYGFYGWEQTVICRFLTYEKSKYAYLTDENKIDSISLAGKKGVIVITRPSDTSEIQALEKQYTDKIAKKEVYTNPFTGAEIYTCWFINKADLFKSPGKIVYVKQN